MILAQECAHLFSTARPNFYAVLDSHMQAIAASHLTARDVDTVFFLLRLHGGAAEKPENHPGPESGGHPGHPVPQIPWCGLCRRSASVRLSGGAPPGGSVAARVAQLYLMDVLFHEVCRRDVQGSAETREAVAEVLSDKHI